MNDTRTVAEIIGWEKFPDPGDSYEVDDLLAWLRGRGYLLDHIEYDTPNGYDIALWHPLHTKRLAHADHRGPTLLAALEAAVRAVSETPSHPAPRTGGRGSGAIGCGDGGDGGRPR